jgi:hypothetical protein
MLVKIDNIGEAELSAEDLAGRAKESFEALKKADQEAGDIREQMQNRILEIFAKTKDFVQAQKSAAEEFSESLKAADEKVREANKKWWTEVIGGAA